jgi:hypothetical protein
MYRLRPLGSTRNPKPGKSSSQIKYSRGRTSAASTTRLVSFDMSYDRQPSICFLPLAALVPGSTAEARGRESRRVRAKTTVVAVAGEVN